MNDTSPRTRMLQIIGKTVIAGASVPVFLYGIESSRSLVRILGGIPSFISLMAIIVLGLLELVWIVLVIDRKLPTRRPRTWAALLRYLGVDAAALFVIGAVPALVISTAAGAPLAATLTTVEMVLIPAAALATPTCFIIARRLRAAR